jgi:uncharacterized protein YjbJ (UPF0337 family)/uncharacterized protein YoxC
MEHMEKSSNRTPTSQEMFSGQWRQMRGTLRSWWGKLTDNDWEQIAGQKDKLLGVLQEKYSYTRDMAEREIERRFNEYRGQSGSMSGSSKSRSEEPKPSTTVSRETPGMAGQMMQQAGQAAAGIQQKVGNLAEDTQAKAQELNTRASEGLNEAKTAVGKKMGSLAETIRRNLPKEGSVGSATQSVANSLSAAGSYLEEHTFEDFSTDMTAVIRRYPLQSLLVGVGIGYLISRGSER